MRIPFVYLLLFALFVPAGLAVTNIAITGDGLVTSGTSIFIVPEHPIPAQLTFTVESTVDTLMIDVSGLDQRLTTSHVSQIDPTRCPSRVCTLSVTIYAKRGSSGLTWLYGLPGAALTTNRLNIQLDTTAPSFVGIGTPTCKNNCALRTDGTTTITAYFSENGIGMDPNTVIATIGEGTFPATTCAIASCDIPVTVPASAVADDGTVTVTLAATAADRAGNKATALKPDTFTVDNDNPAITAILAKTGGTIPGNVVTGPFTLDAAVTDATAVTAVADISSLSSQPNATAYPLTCSNNGHCTASVTLTHGVLGEQLVSVTVTDSAGNTNTASATITVLSQGNGSSSVTWTMRSTVAPDMIDLGTAKLFTTRLFLTLTPVPSDGISDIAALQVTRCTFKSDGKSLSVPMGATSVFGHVDENPIVMLPFNPMGDALATAGNRLDIECQLAVTTITAGRLYATPIVAKLTTSVTLKDNPALPVRIAKMQLDAKNDADKWAKTANDLRAAYSVAAGVCQVIGIPGTMETVGRVTAIVLSAIPFTASSVQAIHQVNEGTEKVVNNIEGSKKTGDAFCAQLTCSGDFTGFMDKDRVDYFDKYASGGLTTTNGYNKLAGVTTGVLTKDLTTGNAGRAFMDPYKSLPIAVAEICVPAIISHVENYAQIQCEYARCMTQDVTVGAPVSACADEKGYQTCRYIGAGIFWTTPAAALQTIRNNVITILDNPLSWVVLLNSYICAPASAGGAVPKGLCRIPGLIQGASELAQKVQQITQITSGLSKANKGCDGLGVPLKDDFYNLNQDNGPVSCNTGLCQSNDVAEGKYVARTVNGQTQYYTVAQVAQKDATGKQVTKQEIVAVDTKNVPSTIQTAMQQRLDLINQNNPAPASADPQLLAVRQQVAADQAAADALHPTVNDEAVANAEYNAAVAAAHAQTALTAAQTAANQQHPAAGSGSGNLPAGGSNTNSLPATPPSNRKIGPIPQPPPGYNVDASGLTVRLMDTPTGGTQIWTASVDNNVNTGFWSAFTGGMAATTEQRLAVSTQGPQVATGTVVHISKPGGEFFSGDMVVDYFDVNHDRVQMLVSTDGHTIVNTQTPDGTVSFQSFHYDPGTTLYVFTPDVQGGNLVPPKMVPDGIEHIVYTPPAGTAAAAADVSNKKDALTAAQREAAANPSTAATAKLATAQKVYDEAQAVVAELKAKNDAYNINTDPDYVAAQKIISDVNQFYVDYEAKSGDPNGNPLLFAAQAAAQKFEGLATDPNFDPATLNNARIAMINAAKAAETSKNADALTIAKVEADQRAKDAEKQKQLAEQARDVALRSTGYYRMSFAVQNALAFQGIISSMPFLAKNIKPGLGMYDLTQTDFAKKTDLESQFIDAVCLKRDDIERGGSVAGFTEQHRVGLALSGLRTQAYDPSLQDFFDKIQTTDWVSMGISPPIIPELTDRNYTYIINGMINTDPQPDKQDARGDFTITLTGSNVPDLTVDTETTPTANLRLLTRRNR